MTSISQNDDDADLTRMWLCFHRRTSESVLRGNAAGLAYLGRMLLSLAEKGEAGSHLHLDETSPLDEANDSLVVVFEDAPWDDPSSQLHQPTGCAGG